MWRGDTMELDYAVIREYVKSQEDNDRRQYELFGWSQSITAFDGSHFKLSPLAVVNDFSLNSSLFL